MKYRTVFAVVAAFFFLGCFALCSCGPEEQPDHGFDTLKPPYEITDSILVNFGDEKWITLDYTARTEHDSISKFDWIYVDAKHPDGKFPRVRMKFFRNQGTFCGTMTIHDIGLGYTVPGALSGDAQCGYVFYYEDGEVRSPDGTVTSDWWPMDITMEVLRYVDSTKEATAYIHGVLFDYESWVKREVTNVEDCETREFTITFGDLYVGSK